ncbi:MAG: hypothetical protein ISS69_02405 [Phycisphaerae bacterium]|nr:hypothetical protein [Phycisphaerae bacterium]
MRNMAGRWCLLLVMLLAARSARAGANAGQQFQKIWTHAAPHSAVIYWRMKDIAEESASYVEYGATSKYGRKTPTARAPRWAHFHRLMGLKPGEKVHYRPVLASKGETTFGPNGTLTTPTGEGWTPVPGKLTGPPYVLDKGGKYILTKDIVAPGTAVTIDAADVVLDLDGHTVRFGAGAGRQAAGIQIRAKGHAAEYRMLQSRGDE